MPSNDHQNTQTKVGISGITSFLPSNIRTSADVEELINLHLLPPLTTGSIERLTGIRKRYISAADQYNSTLAIEACRLLFVKECLNPDEIDLLIFAATGQDILEPATAHIVQAAIGTHAAVMDVKNACNSFLNAIEIAVAFIQTGKYKKVMIATGEVPSKAAKYSISNRASLPRYLAGYTFGDAGTAVLVDVHSKIASIIDSFFFSESSDWDAAMFPGGGSRYLNDIDSFSFRGDTGKLSKPFFVHTKRLLDSFVKKNNIHLQHIEHIFVHQTAELFLDMMCKDLGIEKTKIQITIKEYGNVAAASLPLALNLQLDHARPRKGSYGLFIGLAGGISIGFTLVQF